MSGYATVILAAASLLIRVADCDCAPTGDPFGGNAFQVLQGPLVDSWREVRGELVGDHAMLGACVDSTSTECGPSIALWKIITGVREREGLAMLGHLNRAINLSITPFEPSEWLTALDAVNADGDCKAYATAKYFALREIGIAANRLRLVIVHERNHAEDHMVTAVYYQDRWLILDNLTMTLVRDVDASRYTPMFVLDDQGVRMILNSSNGWIPPGFAPSL